MSGKVVIVIAGDASGAKKALRDLDGALGRTTAQMATFSAAASAVGKRMRTIGKTAMLHVTAPLVAAGFAAGKLASDLAESLQKSNVVFGRNAKAIEKWAESGADSMGLSKQRALEAASTYGNLFDGFEVPEKETYKMSKGLAQLAADLASFNNTSLDDAVFALRSGMTGITKPLKRYGISLNLAETKQEALKLGLIKSTKEALTPATKAMATYSYIMSHTTNAQGDYKRTAHQAANSTRTLIAHVQNAGAALGTILIPYVIAGASWLSKIAGKFQKLSEKTKKFIVIAGLIFAAIGPVVYIFGLLATTIGYIVTPIGLVVLAIGALVAGFVYLYKTNKGFHDFVLVAWPKIKNAFLATAKAIRDYWDQWIYPALHAFGTMAVALWNNFIKPFAKWVIEAVKKIVAWWNSLGSGAKKAFKIIAIALLLVFSPINVIIVAIVALVSWFVKLYKENETFRKVVDVVWNAIRAVVQSTWGAIKVVWDALYWYVTKILMPIWQKVWEIVSWVWGKIWEAIQQAWNNLKPVWEAITWYIKNVLIPVFKAIWDGIKTGWNNVSGVFSAIYDAVVGAWGKIMSAAQHLPKWMKKLFGIDESSAGMAGAKAYGQQWNQAVVQAKQTPFIVGGKQKVSGARAYGGHIFPGKPYLVGERGPEIVTPTRGGFVNTADQTTSMMGQKQENHIYIKTTLGERELIDLLRRYEIITAA